MPCVRDDNGQVVPGAFGSCPIGSTWRRPNGAEIAAMKVYDLPAGSYGRIRKALGWVKVCSKALAVKVTV